MMRYANIELGQEGNEPLPAQYTQESTLVCPRSKKLVLQISKNPVFVQLGKMPQGVGTQAGTIEWYVEEPWLPVIASLARDFDIVRVRRYAPGKAAEVFISVV